MSACVALLMLVGGGADGKHSEMETAKTNTHTHTRTHNQVDTAQQRGCCCHGNVPRGRTSYLAVSPVVHIKNDLTLVLGAMWPRGAVGRDKACE